MSHTGTSQAVLPEDTVLPEEEVTPEDEVRPDDKVLPRTVVEPQVESEASLDADVLRETVLTEAATAPAPGLPTEQAREEALHRFEDMSKGERPLSEDALGYLADLKALFVKSTKKVNWKSKQLRPVYDRVAELIKRVKAMIGEMAQLEEGGALLHRYFVDTLVDDLNALYALIVHFARPDRHGTWSDEPTEDELILQLFARKSGTRHLSADGELGPTPPTSVIAQCTMDGRTFHHKGLPILVIELEHLPPAIVMTILEIRNRRGVSGVVYKGKSRDTEPKTAGGLRSWHQNELGLLPPLPKAAPEKWSEPRGQTYHAFWKADSVEGLAGRQKDKGLKGGESGLYELTVAGTRSTDIRLLYDYARDRFFLTFHYKIILAPGATTTRPKTKQLSVAAAELKSPTAGEEWTSGLFLVDLPSDSPCVVTPFEKVEGSNSKPFPRMPVKLKLPQDGVSLQVPRGLWNEVIAAFNGFQREQDPPRPELEPGSEGSEMIVYNYVTKTSFDFHLTCICDKQRLNIRRIHLAVRLTGCHTSVIYWWYALSWREVPAAVTKIMEARKQKKRPAKGTRIPLVDAAWHLDGEVNGHGADEIESFWARIEPYESLLDGAALLEGLLKELLVRARGVEVTTSQSEEDKGEVFFRLHQ
ncbi:hypothetical protein [Nonomuraea dietziae]|uniref:hypothetical protein n=1 Tax=Nonomuraea dietziae TaxID=65515 RepID=UPI0033E845E8